MNESPFASAWCAEMQTKLMAAIDAAWALAQASDDPAVIAKARDKARLCGQIAAAARKVAALVPAAKRDRPPAAIREAFEGLDAAADPQRAGDEAKPPAAQAVAMRAALRKLKRR